jgi:hypothetical protein
MDNAGADLNIGPTAGGVPTWKLFRGTGNMVVNGTNDIGYKMAVYGTGTAGGFLVERSAFLATSSGGVYVGGTTTPTALLHLKAGTATANTAPLKFTSGTNLTTPEDGAVEYNGTHFYGTIGSTRYQLDQPFGSLPGIDDVLSVGQSLTTNRTIDASSFAFGVLSTGVAFSSLTNPSSTNSVASIASFFRSSSGTAANGIGGALDGYLKTSSGGTEKTNAIVWKLTDVTSVTKTSQTEIRNSFTGSVPATNFTIAGEGWMKLEPISATQASAITAAEGMFVFVNSTNGTFTSIGIWDYENGAWHKL